MIDIAFKDKLINNFNNSKIKYNSNILEYSNNINILLYFLYNNYNIEINSIDNIEYITNNNNLNQILKDNINLQFQYLDYLLNLYENLHTVCSKSVLTSKIYNKIVESSIANVNKLSNCFHITDINFNNIDNIYNNYTADFLNKLYNFYNIININMNININDIIKFINIDIITDYKSLLIKFFKLILITDLFNDITKEFMKKLK